MISQTHFLRVMDLENVLLVKCQGKCVGIFGNHQIFGKGPCPSPKGNAVMMVEQLQPSWILK